MSFLTPRRHILLVGGASGGHFYPLMSIAETLNTQEKPPRLYYAGPEPYDAQELSVHNISFIHIASGKRRRYFSILNYTDIFKTFFGIIEAIIKLYFYYPDVIMSKGGHTSVPIIIAGAFLRIPIIIHESDSVVGRANKIASRYARFIIVAYDETNTLLPQKNVFKLGIPIRKNLLAGPRPEALSALGIDPDRPVLLVIGGSQGAQRINDLILDSLDELLTDFTVLHQTGKEHFELCTLSAETLIPDEERRRHYHPYPFLDGALLNDAYHVAHIVISRAGSNSIYEIALHGKPSIIIPIPEGISHDQRSNAYAYARSGATSVMEEENLTDSLLQSEINRIMQDDALYTKMQEAAKSFAVRDSAERISSVLLEVAHNH